MITSTTVDGSCPHVAINISTASTGMHVVQRNARSWLHKATSIA